jgi:hypothetical protein
MSNIAQTLKNMPAPDASRIKVVFVTNDPDRDDATRLRTWLDTFDPAFIGLRGTPAEVAAAEVAAHIPPSARDTPPLGPARARTSSAMPRTCTPVPRQHLPLPLSLRIPAVELGPRPPAARRLAHQAVVKAVLLLVASSAVRHVTPGS